MVALYAAGQDLTPGDLALVEYGAYDHPITLPSTSFQGLRLRPEKRLLDLMLRLRCRDWEVHGKAVISVE